jgi:hypothetical protein
MKKPSKEAVYLLGAAAVACVAHNYPLHDPRAELPPEVALTVASTSASAEWINTTTGVNYPTVGPIDGRETKITSSS